MIIDTSKYKYIAQRIRFGKIIQEIEFNPDIDKPDEVRKTANPLSGYWINVKIINLEKDLLNGAYK